MMKGLQLTLFTAPGCHLCDDALELLNPWLTKGLQLALVDITKDDLLLAKYGRRIPVVASPNRKEIGWPFTSQGLADWINQLK